MNKRFTYLGLVIIGVMLVGAAAAADTPVIEISLEQALTQALEQNLDFSLIKIDLEQAKKSWSGLCS